MRMIWGPRRQSGKKSGFQSTVEGNLWKRKEKGDDHDEATSKGRGDKRYYEYLKLDS